MKTPPSKTIEEVSSALLDEEANGGDGTVGCAGRADGDGVVVSFDIYCGIT